MESKFMISDVLSTSWKCTKSQIWVLAGLMIGYTIISSILSVFAMPSQSSITGIIVTSLISLIIGCIFKLGYLKNAFQALDGEEPQFSAYGQQASKILTYIIASLIMGIIVCIGLVLLIIPGIYLALRLQFFTAAIIEENAGIIDSLKRSWEITEGQALPLFLLALVMMGLALLGFILLFVGIFVATPLITIMYCDVFRLLSAPITSPSIEE